MAEETLAYLLISGREAEKETGGRRELLTWNKVGLSTSCDQSAPSWQAVMMSELPGAVALCSPYQHYESSLCPQLVSH